MGMITIAIFFALVGLVILFLTMPPQVPKKLIASVPFLIALFLGTMGSVSYNDAGYCVHIRTIFGNETSKCDLGWYFSGWGTSTQWPQFITIANLDKAEDVPNSSIEGPYKVKLADNWAGDVTQTTRFGIPQNEEKFLKMARDFRTPENLIKSTLIPTVKASLDTTSNLFTMEEYYSGGERDAFKKEFRDTILNGPAVTERIEDPAIIAKKVAPSDSDVVKDTSETSSDTTVKIVEKKTDATGQDLRPNPPGYTYYGITVSTAIIQNLDPDNKYEEQIVKRKEALSRRVIAHDQRLEQEEQRLLRVATGATNIAETQAIAQQDQIKQTTEAETVKKLALTKSEQQRDQAVIAKQQAQTDYETNEINQKGILLTAQTQAEARKLQLAADNALQAKLDAEVKIQAVWADAYSKRAVPTMVLGGNSSGSPTGSDSEASDLLKLLTAQTAKSLSYDRGVSTPVK